MLSVFFLRCVFLVALCNGQSERAISRSFYFHHHKNGVLTAPWNDLKVQSQGQVQGHRPISQKNALQFCINHSFL